jgi:hypothetical protein
MLTYSLNVINFRELHYRLAQNPYAHSRAA